MSAIDLTEYLAVIGKAGENKADYAYTPDDTPSNWKLNIGDVRHVGGAVAALGPGGFRGKKVQIPEDALAGVKRKVLAAWRKFHPDAKPEDEPAHLSKKEESMTPEEMGAELVKLQGNLDTITKRNTQLELITKLSAEDRVVYDALPVEKQEEYLTADASKRKEMAPPPVKKAKKKTKVDDGTQSSPADDAESRSGRRSHR